MYQYTGSGGCNYYSSSDGKFGSSSSSSSSSSSISSSSSSSSSISDGKIGSRIYNIDDRNDIDLKWVMDTSDNCDAEYIYFNFLLKGRRPSFILPHSTRVEWMRRRIVYLHSQKYINAFIQHVRRKKLKMSQIVRYFDDQHSILRLYRPVQIIIIGYLTNLSFDTILNDT
jgi:hypothetical protein